MLRFFSEVFRFLKLQYIGKTIPNHAKRNRNVVISLTTLPSRIEGLKYTINSLMDQTVLPDKVILNLPKLSKREKISYRIPDYIRNNPIIFVNHVDKDLGPATKLLPTLISYETDPEKLIIVLDDDQIYPKQLVENYLVQSKKHPDAALTLCGWYLPKDLKHNEREQIYGAIVRTYRRDNSIKEVRQVDCLQGASSYAVKPKLFDKNVFDYTNSPEEAFYVDDIWFSGHLAKRNIQVMVVPISSRFGRLRSIKQFYNESLSKKINSDGSNNDVMYRYFKNEWWSLKVERNTNRENG